MPDELKFEGDKQFFNAALDRADLILHGRNSFEDQPNSPQRKRVVLTCKIDGNRAGSIQSKIDLVESVRRIVRGRLCPRRRTFRTAVIGGSGVFGMFMDRYDVFWLGVHHMCDCRTASPASLVCLLLAAGDPRHAWRRPAAMLDAADVRVTPWRRSA